MKTKILLTGILTGFTGLLLTLNAGAAPAAGGHAGGSAAAAAPAASPNRTIPESPGNTITQSGQMQPGQTTQPGFPDSAVTGTKTANGTITSNATSPANAANQMTGANGSPTANANNPGMVGQAITPSDRMLLATLNQTVGAQLGTSSQISQNSQNAQSGIPVRFLINNGAVTMVGTVSTADESQRILARVQQTPGVLSVFNDLRVGTTAQTAATQQPRFVGAMTDHAFSASDRSLLTAVQQSAGAQLGVSGASATQTPVHFSIENGVVGVTGQVTSLEEKQALIAAIQRTTGVTRVVDNVGIANPAAGGVNGVSENSNPFLNNNNLPPTSRDQSGTNTIFLNTTNNSGL
jgi:osmotically-inducible protein OsmY